MLLAQKRGNFAPALKILIRTSARQLNISPKPTPSSRPNSMRCLAWLAVYSWPVAAVESGRLSTRSGQSRAFSELVGLVVLELSLAPLLDQIFANLAVGDEFMG